MRIADKEAQQVHLAFGVIYGILNKNIPKMNKMFN